MRPLSPSAWFRARTVWRHHASSHCATRDTQRESSTLHKRPTFPAHRHHVVPTATPPCWHLRGGPGLFGPSAGPARVLRAVLAHPQPPSSHPTRHARLDRTQASECGSRPMLDACCPRHTGENNHLQHAQMLYNVARGAPERLPSVERRPGDRTTPLYSWSCRPSV